MKAEKQDSVQEKEAVRSAGSHLAEMHSEQAAAFDDQREHTSQLVQLQQHANSFAFTQTLTPLLDTDESNHEHGNPNSIHMGDLNTDFVVGTQVYQLAIEGGNKKIIGKIVIHKVHGRGKIEKVKGKTEYQVQFDKIKISKKVAASDLDFEESDKKEDKKTDENEEVKLEKGLTLNIKQDTKTECTLKLLKGTHVLASLSEMKGPAIKLYTTGAARITEENTEVKLTKKEHLYIDVTCQVREGAILRDGLLNSYKTGQIKSKYKEAEQQMMAETNVPKFDKKGIKKQSEDYKKLEELFKQKIGLNRKYGPKQMTGVSLNKPIKFKILGKPFAFTYLYTKKQGENEISCYLGTSEWVYERVHTTIDDNVSAHTMVQTGKEVKLPDKIAQDKGKRLGFDTTEGKGEDVSGYQDRSLSPRGHEGVIAKGGYDDSTGEISESGKTIAVMELAKVFHAMLDRAMVDIHGEMDEGRDRVVKGDADVEGHDEVITPKGEDELAPIVLVEN